MAEVDKSGTGSVLVAETASFSARFHDWLETDNYYLFEIDCLYLENAEERILRSHRAESVLILGELLAVDHKIFAS